MKKILIVLVLAISLISCSSSRTPEELAKESCDCYQEAKSYSNTTKRLEKMDRCFRLVQNNLEELQQQGIDNDWNDEQVESARKRFDKIYNECNGNADSE